MTKVKHNKKKIKRNIFIISWLPLIFIFLSSLFSAIFGMDFQGLDSNSSRIDGIFAFILNFCFQLIVYIE